MTNSDGPSRAIFMRLALPWAGAILAAGAVLSFLPSAAAAQTAPGPAAVVAVNTAARPRTYSRMLFGGFLEHFHRQIYGGIYEPGSPLSDAQGFRTDVIAAVKELRTPIVRWLCR